MKDQIWGSQELYDTDGNKVKDGTEFKHGVLLITESSFRNYQLTIQLVIQVQNNIYGAP